MGMADTHPLPEKAEQHLVLYLERNDGEDLTCWFCHKAPCEWLTTFRLHGTRLTVGVHERCRHAVQFVEPK